MHGRAAEHALALAEGRLHRVERDRSHHNEAHRRGSLSLSGPVRAIRIDEFGGPEVMRLVDMPEPEPADGEVLIEVSHAGVNFADTHQRENNYIARYELPLVPGGEVVGVLRSGPNAGQRVVAMTGTGGYAEYATARADTTFPLPDGVDDGTALALLIQGLTAWHLYRTCARIHPGESVVVHSAAGGVGSLAVQLGQAVRRRPRDRHRRARGQARAGAGAGRRRRRGPRRGGPHGRADRGQRRRARGRRARDGRRPDLRPVVRRAGAVRADRAVRAVDPREEPGVERQAPAHEPRRRRLLADALHRQAGDAARAARRPVRAGRTRRGAREGRRGVPAVGGRARARGPTVAAHERQADRGPVD